MCDVSVMYIYILYSILLLCLLCRPLPLELTVVGESVVMENQEVFEKNGFKFVINEDGELINYL